MAHKAGRNASFKVGNNTVTNVISWSLDLAADPITENTMGSDGWTQTFGLSTTGWTGTVELIYDADDTQGQMELFNAVVSGTLLTDLRFYEDDTNYFASVSGTNNGAYINGFPINASAGDVIRSTVNITGSGPLHRV